MPYLIVVGDGQQRDINSTNEGRVRDLFVIVRLLSGSFKLVPIDLTSVIFRNLAVSV